MALVHSPRVVVTASDTVLMQRCFCRFRGKFSGAHVIGDSRARRFATALFDMLLVCYSYHKWVQSRCSPSPPPPPPNCLMWLEFVTNPLYNLLDRDSSLSFRKFKNRERHLLCLANKKFIVRGYAKSMEIFSCSKALLTSWWSRYYAATSAYRYKYNSNNQSYC